MDIASQDGGASIGGFIFFLTMIAMLEFFWWLLIFDHGVVPAH